MPPASVDYLVSHMALMLMLMEDIEFDDIDVPWTATPTALRAALLDTYDIDRLDDDARQRLRSAFLDAVTPLQASDGTIATGWGLRLVRARAA